MPFYEYQCSACEVIFETMATIDEDKDDPPTHCPKCDPDETGPATLYKYFGHCRPGFVIRGGGVYSPGFH